ncbi:MAG: calcineurin-like phosphoesterase C-terminal domain-containing protein, partial [Bythopirellula sp.]
AARMPSEYQMAIHAPPSIAVSKVAATEILANVFNGNKNSTVKMRVRGASDWLPMTKTKRKDPAYVAMFKRDLADEDRPHRTLPEPIATPHMWVANLPAGLLPGVHILEVESIDMFGHVDHGIRLIEVDPDPPVAEAPATTSRAVEDTQ